MSAKIKTIWNKLAATVGKWRLLRLGAVTLLAWSAFIPVFDILFNVNLYNLSPQANAIMGEVNTNLSAKFSYNSEKQEWMFNKEGLGLRAEQLAAAQNMSASEAGEVITQLRKQTGGGGKTDDNLYSVKLPSKVTDGFTYYDNVTNLKFKLIPQDQSYDGKKWGDRLVYPMANGMKAVYTAKANGLKEDIILTKPVGNEVSFSYDMELPKELEARLEPDGSVGIYSADPVLYATTAEKDEDRAKLQSARETAVKDHLVFGLPKPEIIDANGTKKAGSFNLAGDTLIVRARGLEKLAYPLSVDPSVVITSSSDFASGNNEGNIAYNASGSISTAALTGGTFNGTWTSQTNLASIDCAGCHGIPRVAAYNGYLYMINGNHVSMSTIGSNGVIGTWTEYPTNTYTINAHGFGAGIVAYNGYLYVVAGQGANIGVEFAPINPSTGAIGTWTSTTSLPSATFAGVTTVMNGYLYVAGGYGGSTLSTVRYAKLNADGTVGTWAATTALPQVRTTGSGFAYNGYLYVGGGYVDENNTLYSSVVYAKQNADGTLGSWITASSLNQAGPGLGMTVVGGYAYAFGGAATTSYGNGSTRAEYAQINADGSLGTWRTNSSMTLTQARTNLGAFSYTNGADSYVYVLGGRDDASGGYRNTVHSAKITSAGDNNGWSTTTSLPAGRSGGGVIAYNGYLYYVGGSTGFDQSTAQSTVYSAPINANGTVGAWSTASSAFADGFGHVYFGLAVHNGYMYTIAGSRSGSGGASQITTVQYAAINGDGTLGTWTSTTSTPMARRLTTAWAYNGYLYYAGGYHNTSDTACNTTASNYCNDVWRAQLNSSNGSVGTWVQQASLPDQTANTVALVLRNIVYLIDGESTQCGKIAYSAMNSSGTLAGWSTYTANDCRTADPMGGVNNGVLYTWGGAIASSPVATGKYILPGADGSVDNTGAPDSGCGSRWCSLSSNLTNTSNRRKGTSYGGYMYTIGGDNGTTAQTTVEYSPIGNGGGGRIGTWTSAATSSPAGSAGASMGTSGDYIYLTGGADGSTQRNWTAYGQMGADGAVTFTSGTTMTTPRAYHGMAIHNGYVYAVGGSTTGWSPQATVEYAQIQSNGSIGSWSTTASMPEARYSAKTVVHNGYIYVIGGGNASSTLQNTVYYAPINSNGTIGTWSTTSTFTNARVNMAAFAYGGYMYMSGGYDGTSGGTYYNDMQYAPINSDGTLGSWSSMPGPGAGAPRAALYMHASNGFVYWGGGSATVDSTNVAFSDMYRAPIFASGQIGAWEATTSLGTGTFAGASTIANGRLYVYGGRNAGGNTSNLQRASLDAIARVGNYSKLVSLDGQMNNVAVGYNGTLGIGSNVTYAVAPSSGVLGSYSTGTQGSVADPTGTCSADLANATRYVQVRARIDDSQAAVFARNGGYSSMSDISVYYGEALRAPPQLRLHGGKWFKDQSLQPLDTCVSP